MDAQGDLKTVSNQEKKLNATGLQNPSMEAVLKTDFASTHKQTLI